MEKEQQLSFVVQWFDPQAQLTKEFNLTYFGDDTIELVDRHSKRLFLRRIHVPSVEREDLIVGGIITVYSRQMKIVSAANECTKRIVSSGGMNALVVVLPSGFHVAGEILKTVEAKSERIVHLETTILTTPQWNSLDENAVHGKIPASDHGSRNGSTLIEVQLRSANSIEEIISALYSKQLSEYVVIDDKGLELVTGDATKSSLQKVLQSTASFSDCAVGVIRPRIVREKSVGEIIEQIQKAGLEISAISMIHLTMENADELFTVYRGVIPQYHEILTYMSSGPCVALEMHGENAVTKFRELCGPHDVEVAQVLYPDSIRARFGKSNLYNAIHCTDCPEDGEIESRFVFGYCRD